MKVGKFQGRLKKKKENGGKWLYFLIPYCVLSHSLRSLVPLFFASFFSFLFSSPFSLPPLFLSVASYSIFFVFLTFLLTSSYLPPLCFIHSLFLFLFRIPRFLSSSFVLFLSPLHPSLLIFLLSVSFIPSFSSYSIFLIFFLPHFFLFLSHLIFLLFVSFIPFVLSLIFHLFTLFLVLMSLTFLIPSRFSALLFSCFLSPLPFSFSISLLFSFFFLFFVLCSSLFPLPHIPLCS